jgi:DNA modification methylase
VTKPVFKDVPIETLHEDPANARAHPERNRTAVRSSLKEFGQVEALVVQKGTGRVIGGNCRLGELRAMGVETVMVAEVDLGSVEAARLGLILNRSAETAEWDVDNLTALLRGIDEDDDGTLDGLGWTEEELEDLLADPDPGGSGGGLDAIPLPEEAESVLGEVYELGPHRLACGSCTGASVWEALLGKDKIRMVWSDPPYGVSYKGGGRAEMENKTREGIANDELDAAGLRQLLVDALGMTVAHCKKGASWYIAAPPGPPFLEFGSVLLDLGIWRETLAWVKDVFVLGRQDYHYRHEVLFYGWAPGAAHYFVDDRTQDTVHECPRPKKSEGHPTMKPIPLVVRHIRNSSKRGWLVGDPFAGSGTTLLACAETGRVARCIEISPVYCDVIRRRWTRWAKDQGKDPGPGALE